MRWKLGILVVVSLLLLGRADSTHSQKSSALLAPVRGVRGDWWADVVLGQPDFGQITPNEVTAFRVFNVGGVVVDRSVRPNRVYIYDGGNSRILGLSHLGTCQNGTTPGANCTADSDCLGGGTCYIQEGVQADLVIGQPSFQRSACNGDGNYQNYPNRAPASAATLCTMPEDQTSTTEGGSFGNMTVDAQGNLYTSDWLNHRVLRYNSPFTTDTIADAVWGQDDFTGKECNEGRGLSLPDATSLCLASPYNEGFVGGVGLDPQGNLWITDNQNCRVLRFPYNSSTGMPGHTADLVLGHPNFNTPSCGSALNQMFAPAAVRVDSAGSVYVADSLNNRVLIFDPPLTSGMSATRLLGSNLNFPTSLKLNPGGGIWVADTGNHQVLLFEGGVVTKVLLKDEPTYDRECGGDFTCSAGEFCVMCDSRAGIGIDVDGNIILADSASVQDVWRFPAPIPTPTPGTAYAPDLRLFKPTSWGAFNRLSAAGLDSPRGIAIGDNQLIVSDAGRIVYWNLSTPLTNGRPADGCVGVPDCFSRLDPPYGRIKTDDQHHLWVLRDQNILVYQLPLTPGAMPFMTISPPIPVLGGGTLSWTGSLNISGISVSPDGSQLWLTEPEADRVFRVRQPLTSPVVDIVLGQTTVTGSECNQGQSTPSATSLCHPGAVTVDPFGNLFVSDHGLEVSGNHRLLEWDAAVIPANPTTVQFAIPATRVYGTVNNFNIRACWGDSDPMCMPMEPVFDSTGRMVVGLNGYSNRRFPLVYDDPLGSPTPTTTLQDYHSMPFAAAFDKADNLYLVDHNRHRVLVYWRFRGGDPPAGCTPAASDPGSIICTTE